MKIGFTKVNLLYGWLGNMSNHSINHNGKEWRTCEALFQSMRFDNEDVIEAIRLEKSPMGAKFKAKANKHLMKVKPMSDDDLDNMRICVQLKFEQHSELMKHLLETNDCVIFEDVSSRKYRARSLFWGAYENQSGYLIGENHLGNILMDIRKIYSNLKI